MGLEVDKCHSDFIQSFADMEARDKNEAMELGERKTQMNILSYNIRGLGRGIKWASIRKLVGKHKVDVLCLQETKRDSLSKADCQVLWGHPDVAWEWQPAENTAGGLLCIWDNNNFQVDFKISEKGFIMLGGTWLAEMQRVIVVNIYAPCDSEGKIQLWQSLSRRKSQI